jgi:hypothetical protein
MSYANLFSGNKIAPQYLPTEATATPTLSQVLTAGSTANGQNITGVTLLTVNPGNVPAGPNSGIGSVQIFNTSQSAKPTYYEFYNGAVSAGGLDAGDLQLFGYSTLSPGPTTIRQIMNANPEGDAITFGDASIAGGCNVSINGSNGGASRILDQNYNNPLNVGVNTASFPYAGAFIQYGAITRILSATTGPPGIVVMDETYSVKLYQMFGIIPDPTNTSDIQIEYDNGAGGSNQITIPVADNGKLIWLTRVSASSIIRLN